jgi:SAM-dependent methyltransferase
MHVQFLDYLVDPFTRQQLTLETSAPVDGIVTDGFLVSESNRFPIIRGVPRFVKVDNYAESFGWQWTHWPRVQFDSENVGKPMEGHTGRMWHAITGLNETTDRLDGQVVLDIGCGPGRFIEVARKKGALVIGLDYSVAVDAAAKNFVDDPNVCIIQGDALQLPIARGSLDGSFSIGVLHHTPNPASGVKEAFSILKNDGWLALCVYGKGGYYNYPNVQAWRWLFKSLWPYFGEWPALLYTMITINLFRPVAQVSRTLGRAIKVFFPFMSIPDKDWSLLDTFDSITPSYQSGHESFEVFMWFKSVGFRQIEPTNWGSTSYRGIKVE